MDIKIKKEMLVKMVKVACWECSHQECIDCIFRYVKLRYNFVVPIQVLKFEIDQDENEGEHEYKTD